MGSALQKITPTDFAIDDVINALDFPSATDRNKALYILANLTHHSHFYQQYVLQHALPLLMAEVKMKQPNVHDLAEGIIKQITDGNPKQLGAIG